METLLIVSIVVLMLGLCVLADESYEMPCNNDIKSRKYRQNEERLKRHHS